MYEWLFSMKLSVFDELCRHNESLTLLSIPIRNTSKMVFMPLNSQNSLAFHFSVAPNQIERLYSRFTSLDRTDCGTLSREDFLRIPELAINPLCDRIVHAFFADSTDDRVNFRQFMQVLAHFRPIKTTVVNKLNSRDDKLRCKSHKFPFSAQIVWISSIPI